MEVNGISILSFSQTLLSEAIYKSELVPWWGTRQLSYYRYAILQKRKLFVLTPTLLQVTYTHNKPLGVQCLTECPMRAEHSED